jgi:hypothetical protein
MQAPDIKKGHMLASTGFEDSPRITASILADGQIENKD